MLDWIKNKFCKPQEKKELKPMPIHKKIKQEARSVDVPSLKEEINALASQISFLKSRVKDPELNHAVYKRWNTISRKASDHQKEIFDKSEEHFAAYIKLWRLKDRFTKLVTLRALLRNKIHFSPSTDLERWGLTSLDPEELWPWVRDEQVKFLKE